MRALTMTTPKLIAHSIALTAAATLLFTGAANAQDEAAAAEGVPETVETKPDAKTLDELLDEVKNGTRAERAENKRREQAFTAARDNQATLVKNAEAALAAAEARSQALETEYSANEVILADLDTQLQNRLGTLGELFGVVRQVSGDARSNVEDSITSTQLGKDRADFLLSLGKSKKLPAIGDLERLWYELHREMTESGKVVRFDAPVRTPDGAQATRSIIRVGTFNAVSDGAYVIYDADTQGLKELVKQPPARFLGVIPEFEAATSGLATIALDPSRGQILSLLVDTRTLVDQIPLGGTVGWAIIILGIFAAIIAIWRWVVLTTTSRQVVAAQKNPVAGEGNPLARVFQVYESNTDADPETLELRLDEQIMRETAQLERFIWLVKVVSVVAPLMGLLGTVTGMIETFQMITLFGTGDPKMMAGGISVALVTTMLGLMVAIPLVLLHALVANSSKRVIDILEEQSTGLVATRAEEGN